MELLASCSLEESKSFSGKLILPADGNAYPDKVSLNVEVTPENIGNFSFDALSSNVKCVTFISCGMPEVPEKWKGHVFNQVSGSEGYTNIDGVVNLICNSEKCTLDLRQLAEECKRDPSVRVIGGKLLQVEGIRIGRYDKGKDRHSPVYDGMYDTFMEVQLDYLEGIEERISKAKKKEESDGEEKKPKSKSGKSNSQKAPKAEKQPPKKVTAFNNLFGGNDVEF